MLEPRPYTEFDPESDASIEAMAHVKSLLGFIGEDPEREGLVETPKRVVKAMNEHYWGYRADPFEPLQKTFSEVENYDELVLLQNMEIQSHCEHHMVPFVGKVHIGYYPNGGVVGLSKLARVVEVYARRLQTQETMTAQIAQAIERTLKPGGVAVLVEAEHMCMSMRGVQKQGSSTMTTQYTGRFRDPAEQVRFFTMVKSPGL